MRQDGCTQENRCKPAVHQPGLRGGTVTYPREPLKSLVDQGRWDITVYVQRGAFRIDAEYRNVRYREFGPFSETSAPQ